MENEHFDKNMAKMCTEVFNSSATMFKQWKHKSLKSSGYPNSWLIPSATEHIEKKDKNNWNKNNTILTKIPHILAHYDNNGPIVQVECRSKQHLPSVNVCMLTVCCFNTTRGF